MTSPTRCSRRCGGPAFNPSTRPAGSGHGVVVVAHRSRAGVGRLVGKGAVEGSTALEAVERTEIAIMMLPTADEVEEVLFGAGGAARAMAPGYTVIDMGTSFPPQTRRLAARVAERG